MLHPNDRGEVMDVDDGAAVDSREHEKGTTWSRDTVVSSIDRNLKDSSSLEKEVNTIRPHCYATSFLRTTGDCSDAGSGPESDDPLLRESTRRCEAADDSENDGLKTDFEAALQLSSQYSSFSFSFKKVSSSVASESDKRPNSKHIRTLDPDHNLSVNAKLILPPLFAQSSPYPRGGRPAFRTSVPQSRDNPHDWGDMIDTARAPESQSSSNEARSSRSSQPTIVHTLPLPSGSMSKSMGKRRQPHAKPIITRDHRLEAAGQFTMDTPPALRHATSPYSPAFRRSGYSQAPPRQNNHPPNRQVQLDQMYHSDPPRPLTAPLPLPMQSSSSSPRRPYHPPPEICNIPPEFVVETLNRKIAPQCWGAPETADCTIVVPISSPTKSTRTPRTPLSAISFHSNQPQHSFWPPTPVGPVNPTSDARKDVISSFRDSMASSYRRGSTSTLTAPRTLTFPLHRDFLITQSTTLRRLLSANAFHDIATDAASPQTGKNPPPGYGAYVIPTPVGRYPSVFLPVPDPGSLGVLIHWLYWGDYSFLESALSKALVSWQGLFENIHYLQLSNPIKRWAGTWWREWIKTSLGREANRAASPVGPDSTSQHGSEDGDDQLMREEREEGSHIHDGLRSARTESENESEGILSKSSRLKAEESVEDLVAMVKLI